MASSNDGGKGKKKSKSKLAAKKMSDTISQKSKELGQLDDLEKLSLLETNSSNPGIPRIFRENLSDQAALFKETEKELNEKLFDGFVNSMMGVTDNVAFRMDDGDQTPVKGVDAAKLKQEWASGLDWNPDHPFSSPWMRSLAFGNYDEMIELIQKEKSANRDIKTLLQRRETMLNFSALHHVVKGAMSDVDVGIDGKIRSKHIECLNKLIELGANVEAKDFAGFTPLFYCVTRYASDTSCKLAKILLWHGANPNARNRIGNTPLAEPVLSRRLDCIKLLLDAGSDPSIRDNDNCSVESSAIFDKNLKK